ncbi:Na+/H+ antiporter NhaA [Sporichthya brevicatena]|uniref:Na(+)/H(+) antiporter NhaA n=1 Tax=Sporichthya brevicatena TaxID=171442 RepID=A0ABP3R4M9_9ACTN
MSLTPPGPPPAPRPAASRVLFGRLPTREARYLAHVLRDETVGGFLLLAGAVVALVWANSPWSDAYAELLHSHVGPSSIGLDLTVAHWASDGLLALFFFVAGLELKRELVVGELRTPATALLPVVAAGCGMAVPALLYVVVSLGEPGAGEGWAIPTATDIAFALTVLAVAGSSLPTALRAFLLTLAVVDDLGAITIIAIFYTEQIELGSLAGAIAALAAYAVLQRRRVRAWWVYVPLALGVWWLVHDSGVHATVAGVALGLLTRVRPDEGEASSPAERLEHRLGPISAGLVLPVFAFAAAGVAVSGGDLRAAAEDPVAAGVAVGLVVGKFLGVLGGTWAAARWTRAQLSPDLAWSDVAAVATLAGIGFTVSLLIGDLAYGDDPTRSAAVKVAVLAASLVAAAIAVVQLRFRERHVRRRGGERADGQTGQTV